MRRDDDCARACASAPRQRDGAPQLLALDPSLRIESLRGNVETRLRKLRERGLDAIVLAACGLDRLGLDAEIGLRFDPGQMLPEAAQGALALQVRSRRGGARCRRRSRRDAPARRARAALRRHDRRRLSRAGRRAPRRLDAARADRRRGRCLAGAGDRRRSRAGRRRAARCAIGTPRGCMRVVVTRPRDQARPLVERLAALGVDVVECPLIEIERTSDEPIDAAGYDWVVVTSPNGARGARAARHSTCRASRRSGRSPPRRCARSESSRRSCRATASQDGLLREFPQPAGRVLFAAAEGARRHAIDGLGADFVPLYRTRQLAPEPPDGDWSCSPSGSAAQAYAAIGGQLPASRSAQRPRAPRVRPDWRSSRRRRRQTSMASSPPSAI